MKFNFKIQQYQTDAVDAVVKVFNGQGFHDKISYIRDLGKMKSADMQMTLGFALWSIEPALLKDLPNCQGIIL